LGSTGLQISNASHPQRFEIGQMTGVLLNRPTVFPTLRKNRLWRVVKPLLQPRGSTAQALDDIRKHRWRGGSCKGSIKPTLHFYTIPQSRSKARRVLTSVKCSREWARG